MYTSVRVFPSVRINRPLKLRLKTHAFFELSSPLSLSPLAVFLPAVTPAFPLLGWATLRLHLGTPLVMGISPPAKATTERKRKKEIPICLRRRRRRRTFSRQKHLSLARLLTSSSSPSSARFPFATRFAASGPAARTAGGASSAHSLTFLVDTPHSRA